MKYRVTAPVKGATATVAGVSFVDSAATVDGENAAALAYFRRHGYRVEPIEEPAAPPAEAEVPAEATQPTPAEPTEEPAATRRRTR